MRRSARRWIPLRIVACLAALVLLAGVIEGPLFTFYRISGNSMLPSFRDGDRVLVTTAPGLLGGIDVGDAVIAEHGGEVLIKRVVAGPGDQVEMVGGVLLRNGEPVEEGITELFRGHGFQRQLRLGEDQYFVLGDNRPVSVDSRSFGPIRRGEIIGAVIYRFEAGDTTDLRAAAKR